MADVAPQERRDGLEVTTVAGVSPVGYLAKELISDWSPGAHTRSNLKRKQGEVGLRGYGHPASTGRSEQASEPVPSFAPL